MTLSPSDMNWNQIGSEKNLTSRCVGRSAPNNEVLIRCTKKLSQKALWANLRNQSIAQAN